MKSLHTYKHTLRALVHRHCQRFFPSFPRAHKSPPPPPTSTRESLYSTPNSTYNEIAEAGRDDMGISTNSSNFFNHSFASFPSPSTGWVCGSDRRGDANEAEEGGVLSTISFRAEHPYTSKLDEYSGRDEKEARDGGDGMKEKNFSTDMQSSREIAMFDLRLEDSQDSDVVVPSPGESDAIQNDRMNGREREEFEGSKLEDVDLESGAPLMPVRPLVKESPQWIGGENKQSIPITSGNNPTAALGEASNTKTLSSLKMADLSLLSAVPPENEKSKFNLDNEAADEVGRGGEAPGNKGSEKERPPSLVSVDDWPYNERFLEWDVVPFLGKPPSSPEGLNPRPPRSRGRKESWEEPSASWEMGSEEEEEEGEEEEGEEEEEDEEENMWGEMEGCWVADVEMIA